MGGRVSGQVNGGGGRVTRERPEEISLWPIYALDFLLIFGNLTNAESREKRVESRE